MLPVGNGHSAIKLEDRFLQAIMRHIEHALNSRHADYIFPADMGHGHFLIPDDVWDKKIQPHLGADNFDQLVFRELTQNKNVRILYHTAEMFLTLGDISLLETLSDHEKQRNLNRNLVGHFDTLGKTEVKIRTAASPVVSSIEGYTKLAQDIDISASKDSCFPFLYRDKIHFFDISQFSLATGSDLASDTAYK